MLKHQRFDLRIARVIGCEAIIGMEGIGCKESLIGINLIQNVVGDESRRILTVTTKHAAQKQHFCIRKIRAGKGGNRQIVRHNRDIVELGQTAHKLKRGSAGIDQNRISVLNKQRRLLGNTALGLDILI